MDKICKQMSYSAKEYNNNKILYMLTEMREAN
jgi:hypothetical protein